MGIFILVIIVLSIGISFGFMLGFSKAMRDAARDISKSNPSPSKFLPKLIIAIAVGFLVAALAIFLNTRHFIRTATQTTGTVVELRETKDREDDRTSYAPVFRFKDSAGTEHTVSSSLSQYPAAFQVGEIVPVLYQGSAPGSARIDTYGQVWGLASLLAIFGAIQLPIGMGMLLWPRLKGRST
jgi:hypothetical protein